MTETRLFRPAPATALEPAIVRRSRPSALRLTSCQRWPETRYFLAAPPRPSEDAPVLVSVHGISRNAREHAETFAAHCGTLGWFVVAPLFSRQAFPKYQQLGFGGRGRGCGPRPDLALNAILDEVQRTTGADASRVFLFGYSGGGQFAHRYALLHPRRVLAAVLGASGWYSFPDRRQAYPRGLKRIADALGCEPDLDAFLRLPVSVMVGDRDYERDAALNASPAVDRQQGLTRPERGRRWLAALRREAERRGIVASQEYLELPACGHSFAECMAEGRLALLALDFFVRSRRGPRAAGPAAACASQTAFLC